MLLGRAAKGKANGKLQQVEAYLKKTRFITNGA
jgi:hypothetical protein